MKKTVIFDMDGTLLYTLADIADAVNRALAGFGLPGYSEDEYRKMVGYGLKELVRRAAPDVSGDILSGIYDSVLDEYSKNPVGGTFPYPGITDMLSELKSAGVAMGILSNKEDSLVQLIADKLLPVEFFKVIRGKTPDFPSKPDPSSLNDILDILEADKSGSFFVGDSGADMEVAVNAGITPVGVSWGYRNADHLKKLGAVSIADSPADIVNFVMEEQYGR